MGASIRTIIVGILFLLAAVYSINAEDIYTIPDAELMNTTLYSSEYYPDTLGVFDPYMRRGGFRVRDWSSTGAYEHSRSQLSQGVIFDLTVPAATYDSKNNLIPGKIALADQYPSPSWLTGFGSDGAGHMTSLSGYHSYQMGLSYVGDISATDTPLTFQLFMNTGLCGVSGTPTSNPANDTFWQGPAIDLDLGDMANLELDFRNAQAYNIADNPSPHTQGNEGQILGINSWDIKEVTNIGIQVLNYSDSAARVYINMNAPVPAPGTLALLGLGSGLAFLARRRRKTRSACSELAEETGSQDGHYKDSEI